MPPSLGRVPFLLGLEPTVIDKLLGNALLLECDAGETLIIEGDDSKFFCILLKGSMDVIKDGKKITRISNSGEMLGELALVNDRARTASVIAATHSFCLKVEPKFLDGLSDAERNGFYAKLYQFVAKILGDRLDERTARIAHLEKRISELSGDDGDGDGGEPSVFRL